MSQWLSSDVSQQTGLRAKVEVTNRARCVTILMGKTGVRVVFVSNRDVSESLEIVGLDSFIEDAYQ